MKPVRIEPRFVGRPWGSTTLEPWFHNRAEKTGEVWFEASKHHPLLVKFLFTSQNLSVQVHPDDEYARIHHQGSRGKTEMWHILDAGEESRIAVGFKREISPRELRESAESGGIVDLLNWVPVQAGETYLTPAGTVHAIGGGITLCEIQQNSDVTYRLYDYDRKPQRELHLDHGEKVSYTGTCPGVSLQDVACDHFVTEVLDLSETRYHVPEPDELLVILSGNGKLGDEQFSHGEVWHVPEGTEPFAIEPCGQTRLLRTYPPRT